MSPRVKKGTQEPPVIVIENGLAGTGHMGFEGLQRSHVQGRKQLPLKALADKGNQP